MTVLESTLGGATKSSLQRETVNQVEFLPHDDAGSGLTCLLNDKVARVESEILIVLAKK